MRIINVCGRITADLRRVSCRFKFPFDDHAIFLRDEIMGGKTLAIFTPDL